jgi:hypothetical protein
MPEAAKKRTHSRDCLLPQARLVLLIVRVSEKRCLGVRPVLIRIAKPLFQQQHRSVWAVSGQEALAVIVDASDLTLHGTVPTGQEPAHVILIPDGSTAWLVEANGMNRFSPRSPSGFSIASARTSHLEEPRRA